MRRVRRKSSWLAHSKKYRPKRCGGTGGGRELILWFSWMIARRERRRVASAGGVDVTALSWWHFAINIKFHMRDSSSRKERNWPRWRDRTREFILEITRRRKSISRNGREAQIRPSSTKKQKGMECEEYQ